MVDQPTGAAGSGGRGFTASWACVAALCAVFCAASAWAQTSAPPEELTRERLRTSLYGRGFTVWLDDPVIDQLLEVQAHLNSGEYVKAFRLVEERRELFRDRLVPWSKGLYLTADDYFWRQLVQLSPAGREAFRRYFDARAEQLAAQWDAASPEQAEALAKQIFDSFFLTSVGDNAANRLGDAAFRRGEFLQAAEYWQAVLEFAPDSELPELELRVKRATALHRGGELETRDAERSVIASRFPEGEVVVAGRRQKAADYLAALPPAPVRVASPSVAVPHAPSVRRWQWRIRRTKTLVTDPLVVGDKLIVHDGERLVAYSVHGKSLWGQQQGGLMDRVNRFVGGLFGFARSADQPDQVAEIGEVEMDSPPPRKAAPADFRKPDPAAPEPAAPEPAAPEPAAPEPAALEPAALEPAALEPAALDPAVPEPAPPAAPEAAAAEEAVQEAGRDRRPRGSGRDAAEQAPPQEEPGELDVEWAEPADDLTLEVEAAMQANVYGETDAMLPSKIAKLSLGDDGRIYTNLMESPARLIAMDPATGGGSWTATLAEQGQQLASAPLMRGELVFVAAYRSANDLYLNALDAGSGKLRWQVRLGSTRSASSDGGQTLRSAASLAAGARYVHVLTNDGALVSVESASGAIAWMCKTAPRRMVDQSMSWGVQLTPPPRPGGIFLHRQLVVYKESGAPHVHAFDTRRQQLAWSRRVLPSAQLVGVDGDYLFLLDHEELEAVNWRRQELQWSVRLPAVGGGILMGEQHLLVPTVRGIFELDRDTGDLVRIARDSDLAYGGGFLAVLSGQLVGINHRSIRMYFPSSNESLSP